MIIFAGIVARLPRAFMQLWEGIVAGDLNPIFVLIALGMFVVVIVLVIYEQRGQRKIPVHYAKRVVGRRMYGSQNSYIPFKINPSGVIPVIFASSLLLLPATAAGFSDTTNLPPGDLARYQSDRIPATYHWDEYLEDVIDALRDAFGASAVDTSGNKSIKVARAAGRLPVDVVPAMHYRRYYQYPATGSPRYVEGIRFLTRRERRAVINYPKLHIANGQTKNKSTPEYKASVRMIKNARRVACDLGLVPTDAAPSYFLECLLYNAPDELFTTVRSTSYLELLSWALDAVIEERALVCGNGIVPLFGASPEQWDRGDAMATLSGLVKLWREL